MSFSIVIATVISILLSVAPSRSFAQSNTPVISESTPQSFDAGIFVAQRFWFSSWDVILFDAHIVTQNPSDPVPVVQTDYLSTAESAVLPVTSIGARFGDWSLAGSVTPTTDISVRLANGGEVSRSEYDINVGYAINEYFSTALIYKSGTIKNTITTTGSSLGSQKVEQDVDAWLIGLSGRAPTMRGVSMYGNVALGSGRLKTKTYALEASDTISNDIVYSIGEVGVSYQFQNVSFGSWSVQIGYRLQSVLVKDAESYTFNLSPAQNLLSTTRRDLQSTTQGIIIGLTAGF